MPVVCSNHHSLNFRRSRAKLKFGLRYQNKRSISLVLSWTWKINWDMPRNLRSLKLWGRQISGFWPFLTQIIEFTWRTKLFRKNLYGSFSFLNFLRSSDYSWLGNNVRAMFYKISIRILCVCKGQVLSAKEPKTHLLRKKPRETKMQIKFGIHRRKKSANRKSLFVAHFKRMFPNGATPNCQQQAAGEKRQRCESPLNNFCHLHVLLLLLCLFICFFNILRAFVRVQWAANNAAYATAKTTS